jgi:hypothetical protein
MSSNIVLLGWEAENLRCPNHKVNLVRAAPQSVYPVTLLQMPNGTGKTTTLSLLRATLSGGAESWPEEKIREFQNKHAKGPGRFIVRMAADDTLVTFELTLKFGDGSVQYRTTLGAGVQKGFKPPANLRRFLKPDFVDLFVFDGELATRLLDSQTTRARAALDTLFQLPILARVSEIAEENWQKHAMTVSAKQEKGLTQRKNRLVMLDQQIAKVKKRKKKLEKDIPLFKEQLAKLQVRYQAELGKDKHTREELERLDRNKVETEALLRADVDKVITKLRDPHALLLEFAAEMVSLKSNMDRLKLPRSTAREFFDELTNELSCICARPMDDDAKSAIRKRAASYLGEEQVGVLNTIKSDVATHCGDEPSRAKASLDGDIKALTSRVIERDRILADREAIEANRLAGGNAVLEKLKSEVDERSATLTLLEDELGVIEGAAEGDEADDTNCLKALDDKRADARKAVAEASNTVSLKKKTEVLARILASAQDVARIQLKDRVVQETNEKLKSLLVREPVELADVDESLILKGQAGASVGQTLAVSYAFLATLFGRSDYQLPFIVDSPAGPLDLNVRPEVAKMIPKLCGQFVAFTISSERDKFVQPLAKAVGNRIQYLTLFRGSKETRRLYKGIKKSNVQESSDGALITGQEFFERFDLDEEA